jgi:hypothetical protein
MSYYGDYTTWAPLEEPLVCNSCLKRVKELFPCTWDPENVGQVGACCLVHEDDMAPEEPLCPAADLVIAMAHTAHELLSQLKAHAVECAACGSNKRTLPDNKPYQEKADAACGGKEVA